MMMRNKFCRFLLLLFVGMGSSVLSAEEVRLLVSDFVVAPGQEDVEIPVYLVNEGTPICNLQLDVKLPDGLDFSREDSRFTVLKGGRAQVMHTVACGLQTDGALRILMSSMSNVAFEDSEAMREQPVLIIKCKVNESLAQGDYEMELKGIVLNNYNFDTGVTMAFAPETVKVSVGCVNTGIAQLHSGGRETVDVFSVSGVLLREKVSVAEALKGLPQGVYVVGGETWVVK